MILKVYSIFFLTLVFETLSYDFNDLSTLGQQITDDVNRQVAPLQNLGARISASVENSLRPLRSRTYYGSNNGYNNWNQYPSWNQHSFNYQYSPQNQYTSNFKPSTSTNGATSIDAEIASQPLGLRSSEIENEDVPKMKPQKWAYTNNRYHMPSLGLENLGAQIQQNVYESLAPVRALEITAKMKGGIGGVTIVTHFPQGKKFIIKNHQTFTCDGQISETTGQCSGSLLPFIAKDKTDICYNINSYTIVNNKICIGANSVSVINNIIKCDSYTGTPAVLMDIEEYNKLCHGLSESLEFRYIANPDDPMHVIIPNENKYVKCNNKDPGVCVFNVSHILPENSNNIFIGNNLGTVSSYSSYSSSSSYNSL